MPRNKASRNTKPKTRKKTRISVRGRLSLYLDPFTLHSHKEKTLHFIGVGRLENTAEAAKTAKSGSRRPKPAVCKSCGRVWKREGKNSGILKTCPECEMKRKIASEIRIHIP